MAVSEKMKTSLMIPEWYTMLKDGFNRLLPDQLLYLIKQTNKNPELTDIICTSVAHIGSEKTTTALILAIRLFRDDKYECAHRHIYTFLDAFNLYRKGLGDEQND